MSGPKGQRIPQFPPNNSTIQQTPLRINQMIFLQWCKRCFGRKTVSSLEEQELKEIDLHLYVLLKQQQWIEAQIFFYKARAQQLTEDLD